MYAYVCVFMELSRLCMHAGPMLLIRMFVHIHYTYMFCMHAYKTHTNVGPGTAFSVGGFLSRVRGFYPFPLLSEYIYYNRKLNITFNFRFHMTL